MINGMINPNDPMEKVPPYSTITPATPVVVPMGNVAAYDTWTNGLKFQATRYLFSGPTTGAVSVASTAFTVSLPTGVSTVEDVTVTMSDNSGGGEFSKATILLNAAQPSGTFTYTPDANAGAKVLSVTNNKNLTNPADITYTTS